MSIARYFDESKVEPGMSVPVPLRDLTDEEFDALPKHLQASVDAWPFFRKTNPTPERRAMPRRDKPDEET